MLAREFLEVFDGYSIGSNDLTQLTLGLDRDSGTVARLFDENNPAVRRLIADAITAAHRARKPIGICGQAPSDFPEFAEWLTEQGIDSISLNPDTAIKTALSIARAEARLVSATTGYRSSRCQDRSSLHLPCSYSRDRRLHLIRFVTPRTPFTFLVSASAASF